MKMDFELKKKVFKQKLKGLKKKNVFMSSHHLFFKCEDTTMNVLPSSSGNMLMTLSDGALQCAEKNTTVGKTIKETVKKRYSKNTIKYVRSKTHTKHGEKRQKNRFSTLQRGKHGKRVTGNLSLGGVATATGPTGPLFQVPDGWGQIKHWLEIRALFF